MIDEKVDDPKSGEPAANTQINRVIIEPSEFSEATAADWFFIIEAQFQVAQMNVSSKNFNTELLALPATLKHELFKSLLSTQVLTERPSVFFETLQSTAQKVGVGDEFVRHKFLESLPQQFPQSWQLNLPYRSHNLAG